MLQKQKSRPSWRITQAALWGGLFCLSLLLNILARKTVGFAEGYAVYVYPLWVGSLGRICSLIPVSVSEMILLAGMVWLLVWMVRAVCVTCGSRSDREKRLGFWKRSAWWALRLLVLVFFLFTVNCGINYHRLTFSQRAGFQMQKSTVEELASLCLALTEEVNEAAAYISVDEQGACQVDAQVEKRAREAMQAAASTYGELEGYYPKAKGIRNSWILSYQQLTGIYSPFTIESNYNRDMPDYSKPSTICHELSHLKGFMREDEANFIAYLACRASKDWDFKYSGSMMAYVYSTNALYREDKELYRKVRGELCEQANRDLQLYSAFWEAYEGKVAEVSDKVNDTYLKANAQAEGTKSYGRMVDLLLALRRSAS